MRDSPHLQYFPSTGATVDVKHEHALASRSVPTTRSGAIKEPHYKSYSTSLTSAAKLSRPAILRFFRVFSVPAVISCNVRHPLDVSALGVSDDGSEQVDHR